MTCYDVYDEAFRLSKLLKDSGAAEQGYYLARSVSGNSSGEALSSIAISVKEILDSGIPISNNILNELKKLGDNAMQLFNSTN